MSAPNEMRSGMRAGGEAECSDGVAGSLPAPLAWARCGAMSLTGCAGDAPSLGPARLAAWADASAAELCVRVGLRGTTLDGAAEGVDLSVIFSPEYQGEVGNGLSVRATAGGRTAVMDPSGVGLVHSPSHASRSFEVRLDRSFVTGAGETVRFDSAATLRWWLTPLDLAGRIAAGPGFANMMTKTMLAQEWSMGLEQAIEAEAQAQAVCMQTEDYQRAYDAFVKKEKPVFEGN